MSLDGDMTDLHINAIKKAVGVKKDQGKLRMDLLPPDVIEGLALILTHGAEKYTTRFKNKWEGLWALAPVKKISLYIVKGCVVHVMKNNLGKIILSLQNDNAKIQLTGQYATQNENETWIAIETKIQNCVQEINEQNGFTDLKRLALLKPFITKSYQKAVQYVEQKNTSTSITTIVQENIEEYYVVDITMDSDFLETIFQVLKKHLDISKKGTLHELPGDRNWELGMDWGRLVGAALRHVFAFVRGEDIDPESGLPHIDHALCCIAFLSAYQKRGVGVDDRVKLPGQSGITQKEGF